jgi:hypothetical protein
VAPAAAILRAVSAPMPRAAPETNATFPSRRFMTMFLPSLSARDWQTLDHHQETAREALLFYHQTLS